jgi:arylsulfatase A-like enzyme
MKDELMPGFDRAFYGLINDLDQRGMLDSTLVVVLSEHGRTPKITPGNGGGRDHWAQAYTAMFSGGGTARGKVVGKTDKIGGTVTDRPVSPKDLLATVYHLLGYDPDTVLRDKTGRPQALLPVGSVVREVLA